MLSVVVTVVDGGAALRRTLDALTTQRPTAPAEVIVPYDETVTGIPRLAHDFPGVVFLPMGAVRTRRPADTNAGQHELIDRRRSAGLARATGALIALVEDRGVPRPDWSTHLVEQHERLPYAVIGGAVDNGQHALLNRAVYYCDFLRYGRPFEPGLRTYLSDVNVCYKRAALDLTTSLWLEQYHETTVHWALSRAGERLYLSDQPVVNQVRDGLTLPRLLAERFAWGRLFAYTRTVEVSLARRIGFAAGTPLLPLLLFSRQARRPWPTASMLLDFVVAAPVTLLLLSAWSVGEFAGYVTGDA